MSDDHKPILSFLCPAYNHSKYVAEFLQSLFSQTVSNWELIIVDDCSSDNTVEIIKQFPDPRIRLICHDMNQGINAGLNDALSVSAGEYVSFVASDDLVQPEYVQMVAETFQKHPGNGYLMVALSQMDEKGRTLQKGSVLQKIEKPQSEEESQSKLDGTHFFRDLFLRNNQLQSPGLAMRRGLAERVFPLKLGFFVLQDVATLLALSYYSTPCYIAKPLIKYRVFNKSASHNKLMCNHLCAETRAYMDLACELVGEDWSSCEKHFGDLLEKPRHPISPLLIPFSLARVALRSDVEPRRLWGMQKIIACCNNPKTRKLIEDELGLSFGDILKIVRSCKKMPCISDTPKVKAVCPGIAKTKIGRLRVISIFGMKIKYYKED